MLDYQVEKNIVDCNSMSVTARNVEDKASAMDDSQIDQVLEQVNIASNVEFESKLSEYWHEAANDEQLLSVLMCEVDFYDEYVLSNGLQGAYFMMMVVALALKNICEKHDCFLAHRHQEKFAVLIKGGDHKQIFNISEGLREAVENSKTEHQDSRISRFVTLSVGVSITAPQTKNSSMNSVGYALQNAKIAGRNQISNDLVKRKFVETITETVATKVKEQGSIAPKQKDSAPKGDEHSSFIEQDTENNMGTSKMYRGHDLFAESKEEVKEEAKPAVRMYRGHPIV